MNLIASFCIGVFCAVSMLGPNAQADTHTSKKSNYSFGIVPQQATLVLARKWAPIIRKISQDTGVSIAFKTAPTIPEFERRLARGEYDFAYMNPYHYVVFSKLANYAAFAKQKNKRITGVLVTAKDSKIQSVNDLRGTKLVFPSPGAFAATILTQAYLTQQGIGFSSEYVGSHDSVYLNVATKRFAAGGGISRTLNSAPPEVKGKLKVLWLSPGYTPHAFAAHTRVPADVVQAVEQSMVNFHATVKGQALLSQIRFKAIEKASSVQWDDVRSLGINPEKALSLINAD